METKKEVNPTILIAAAVLLVIFVVFMAFRSFGGGGSTGVTGSPQTGAGGGEAARVVAPQVQHYPDGTVVPYNTAPAGSMPGNPAGAKQ